MIRLVGKRGKGSFESQLDETAKGQEFVRIDCTSGNPDPVMREGLSPFYLGPVECYDGLVSQTFENAWQFSKVYPDMKFWKFTDAGGGIVCRYEGLLSKEDKKDYKKNHEEGSEIFIDAPFLPTGKYFEWRDFGWNSPEAYRFPAGKNNAGKCKFSWWKVDGKFQRLVYIPARKQIYIPLYARAVVKTEAYRRLVELRDSGKNLMLIDFDGYNIHHPKYNFTYNDAIHCPLLKMGHGFVLAMLLEGVIKVDEDGNVIYADGLMDDPHKLYSPDLRKLTDEQKLDRAAACAGVTVDELRTLSEADRKMLKRAYSREACKARGIARAAWERLPLTEKLRVARLEEQTHGPVSAVKESVVSEENSSDVVDSALPRPSDLTDYFDAGSLVDAAGAIPGWAATDRSDIVRLWIPKTVVSIGNFAFKGCANLEEIVFEASPDGADQTIGTMAFAGCPKLGKVLLSGSVRSIGSGAFRDDFALTTLQVDPFWKQIQVGPHAFDNCPAPDELQKQIAGAKIDIKRKPVAAKPTAHEEIATSAEFDAFWEEFADWWGASDGEEVLTLKNGKTTYKLRCGWNEGTLVVAMISPWPKEWDYVQLYRGMFGWGDVGDGFYDGKLRKKVAKLLLDQLIRRNKWMQENPAALAEREREIKESMNTEGEGDEKTPSWFDEYRWIRNRMAEIGEGDMRLYVKGDNHIWGAPIQCEWAISDMRNS